MDNLLNKSHIPSNANMTCIKKTTFLHSATFQHSNLLFLHKK